MSEMNTTKTEIREDEAQEAYTVEFLPNVHRIGRITMVVALFFSFLPAAYFLIVKGYTAPLTDYINIIVAICVFCFGVWVTEPLAYWPVLGSAGTYMGYLSGNVSGMRFPVALNLQSAMKADINTPRGQIVTIVGIVASIFTNLVILLLLVIGGDWLVTVMPAVVLASFTFVMSGLVGSMFIMRWAAGKNGLVKEFLSSLPYIVIAIVIEIVADYVTFISTWSVAIIVGLSVLYAYGFYRRDSRNDESAETH